MSDTSNPFPQGFFFAKSDPATLKMREKIALAQMMQKKKVPTNLGEGIYSVGESIANAMTNQGLMDADKAAQIAASKSTPVDAEAITPLAPVAPITPQAGAASSVTAAPIEPVQASSIVPARPAEPAPPDVPGAIRMSTPAQLADFRAQNPTPIPPPPATGAAPPQAMPTTPMFRPPPGTVGRAPAGGEVTDTAPASAFADRFGAAFPNRAPSVVAAGGDTPPPDARNDAAIALMNQQKPPPTPQPVPQAPPTAPGLGIQKAPPPGQPQAISGYVPPSLADPTEATIVKPSKRELQLQSVMNANQGNPYYAGGADAKALAELVDERNKKQAFEDLKTKAAVERATKREEMRQGGLMDQSGRIVSVAKEQEAVNRAQLETDVLRRTGGLGNEPLLAPVVKSQERVAGVPGATQALRNARLQLEQGIFTGAGAEQKLAMAKSKETLASLFGMDANDPKIANTEAFRATIMPLVAQARSATSGNANISDADIRLALSAVGGDITLDAKTFPRVLDALERINLGLAIGHQGRVTAAAGGNETAAQALQGAYGLPMEDIIPPRFIQRLKEHPETAGDFDKTFKTPGLSRRILGQ